MIIDIYGLKPDRSELDKHPAYYNKKTSRNLLGKIRALRLEEELNLWLIPW